MKKFLNDESKSPVIDFLLWLIVYPFVIAFAVACVINIFQFSIFQGIKFTDWVMAGCTVGILIGTWKAASYAKKAAYQAQEQNKNAIISKIDDVQGELIREMDSIKPLLNSLKSMCNDAINHIARFKTYNDTMLWTFDNILNKDLDISIYRYKLFLINIIEFKDFNEVIKSIHFMKEFHIKINPLSRFSIKSIHLCELNKEIDIYLKLTEELSNKISEKYQELNGCS
ncbi:hypothetical protein [Rodentibacter myodis]|uniref:hypothetical protein n=1 Tax=Rodentibacter myodis TaxID=1907939 RepID=UPI00117BAFBB|nr:hypothetical protein [Rodentibacter myodis]